MRPPWPFPRPGGLSLSRPGGVGRSSSGASLCPGGFGGRVPFPRGVSFSRGASEDSPRGGITKEPETGSLTTVSPPMEREAKTRTSYITPASRFERVCDVWSPDMVTDSPESELAVRGHHRIVTAVAGGLGVDQSTHASWQGPSRNTKSPPGRTFETGKVSQRGT